MAKHKTKTPVARPRHLGKHVGETLDFIQASGGIGATVTNGKHLRFQFNYKGQCCWFMLSSTPKDRDECAEIARSLVRRAIRQVEATI